MFFNVYAADDATLKNIKINNQECECVEYKCEMEVDASQVTITYELSNSEATVSRESGISTPLSSDVTTISVTVEHGESRNIYDFVITKHVKSNDITLKYLALNEEEITLMPDVYVYNMAVPFDQEEIIIEATPTDSKAAVDKELAFLFPVEESSKSFDFTVTAENGDEKNYRIFVTRESKPDTTLKSLKLDQGSIKFDKDTLEYNITVEYNVTDVLIEALPNDSEANVKITKEDLVVGENIITIEVTNKNATSVYKINVNREPNLDKSQANLEKLIIKEYPKLNFEPNILEYDLKFEEIPSKLTIEAIAIKEEATIEIVGNENLTDDSVVTIDVTVKEEEFEITRTYKLVLNKITHEESNKLPIIITIIILVITMIILLILEIRERKNKNIDKTLNKTSIKDDFVKKETIKEEIEEEIEII